MDFFEGEAGTLVDEFLFARGGSAVEIGVDYACAGGYGVDQG